MQNNEEDEEWSHVKDFGKRRQIQNRIAQRRYRERMKKAATTTGGYEKRISDKSDTPALNPAQCASSGSLEAFYTGQNNAVPMSSSMALTQAYQSPPHQDGTGFLTEQLSNSMLGSPQLTMNHLLQPELYRLHQPLFTTTEGAIHIPAYSNFPNNSMMSLPSYNSADTSWATNPTTFQTPPTTKHDLRFRAAVPGFDVQESGGDVAHNARNSEEQGQVQQDMKQPKRRRHKKLKNLADGQHTAQVSSKPRKPSHTSRNRNKKGRAQPERKEQIGFGNDHRDCRRTCNVVNSSSKFEQLLIKRRATHALDQFLEIHEVGIEMAVFKRDPSFEKTLQSVKRRVKALPEPKSQAGSKRTVLSDRQLENDSSSDDYEDYDDSDDDDEYSEKGGEQYEGDEDCYEDDEDRTN